MVSGALERSCRTLSLCIAVVALASGVYFESGLLLTLFGLALAGHLPLLARDARRTAFARR